MSPPTPSSSTTGFFQAAPVIPPQFQSDPTSTSSSSSSVNASGDPVLQRLLSLYLPHPIPDTVSTDLSTFSALILTPPILSHTRDCETHPPTLHPLNTFGEVNRIDALRTSEGWRSLQEVGIREGIVGLGSDECVTGWNRRIHQFAKIHLWTGSAALVTCPSAMTDGATVLLGKHLSDPLGGRVFAEARRRLISRDPREAWTSGQWMTERKGGSDVRGTETVAVRLPSEDVRGEDRVGMPLGGWRVDGFKWFSSATDADMAVLLAQTERGLSAFYAPLRLSNGEMNGVRIQRLKEKMGTKGLPTAELEIKGMRAWLVGKEGEGVKEVSGILNITRLHTAIAAVGYWGRGLAVSRAWSEVRRVSGGMLLRENSQHVRWMADETIKYRAAMQLVFFGVALLGVGEQWAGKVERTWADNNDLVPRNKQEIEILLRVVTPLMKAQTSLASIEGLRACMESLGGVGYLENNENIIWNIARLYRDANVGAIWEGTTSVMAEDLVRVLKGKTGEAALQTLEAWIEGVLRFCTRSFAAECSAIRTAWAVFTALVSEKEVAELHWDGREILRRLEAIICGCLLMMDSVQDGEEISSEVARRWARMRLAVKSGQRNWKENLEMDRRIFLGGQSAEGVVPKEKARI